MYQKIRRIAEDSPIKVTTLMPFFILPIVER